MILCLKCEYVIRPADAYLKIRGGRRHLHCPRRAPDLELEALLDTLSEEEFNRLINGSWPLPQHEDGL